jgi:hypothetical protein
MKIYLANHHEAVIVNDRKKTVSIEPAAEGVLVVNGLEYPIKAGGDAPDFRQETAAHVNAVFIKDGGVAYAVLSPRLYRGELTTHIDPYAYAIECRLHLDRLEKELEALRDELRHHIGTDRKAAMDFLPFKKS